MRYFALPSDRSLSFAAWLLAGGLATMACVNPNPVARTFLLTLAFTCMAANVWRIRRAAKKLRADAATLARDVEMLERAEGLAEIGRWCIEMEPRRHMWSEEMCQLAGLPAGTAPREDILERIMPAGIQQIETVLAGHEDDRETFAIEFEVESREGQPRMFRARARNIFGPDNTCEQVFMVVRDVSGHYALERDRDEALARAAQARREADTDDLTGLANRRFAMGELDRSVIASRQAGEPLSVIVFDIDHFKAVNDRYGHPVGDKVIAKVAAIAARQARERDTVGRIGGEEFLWIMPGCDSNAALRAAERLRWAVEAGTHSAPIPAVTISAGHAEMEKGDASLLLFARADDALYEAKRGGRNRVEQAA